MVLCLFTSGGFAANTGLTCSADTMMEDFEKSLMSCMIHNVDAGLMIKIIENIKHPEKLLTLDFICGYQDDMAKIVECMVQKYAECLPSEISKIVLPLAPSEQRWKKIIKFACAHRNVLSDQCLTEDSSSKFMNCYQNKLGEITAFSSLSATKQLLCRVRQSFDGCILDISGSGKCSDNYFNMVGQIVNMMVDLPSCPNFGKKVVNPFSGVLLQGHPLKFEPMGKH